MKSFLKRTLGFVALLAMYALTMDVANAQSVTGQAVSVYDGDTITLKVLGESNMKIRLSSIDTPEMNQAHGVEARDALRGMISGKSIQVKIYEKDKYGRYIGEIFLNGESVNNKLVEQGHAWHYVRYSHSKKALSKLEKSAKERRIGLWSANKPLEPWKWRAQNR